MSLRFSSETTYTQYSGLNSHVVSIGWILLSRIDYIDYPGDDNYTMDILELFLNYAWIMPGLLLSYHSYQSNWRNLDVQFIKIGFMDKILINTKKILFAIQHLNSMAFAIRSFVNYSYEAYVNYQNNKIMIWSTSNASITPGVPPDNSW